MPETGQSWQKGFPAEAVQARAAREWVQKHSSHDDAAQLAGELFVAVLACRPAAVQMTVSTAGPRERIVAAGDRPVRLHVMHGPGGAIISALAPIHGISPDDRGFWADLPRESA